MTDTETRSSHEFPAVPCSSRQFPEFGEPVPENRWESEGQFPPAVPAVPGSSPAVPGSSRHFGNQHGERFPGLPIDREPGTAGSAVPPHTWIHTLQSRQLTIEITPTGPQLHGPLHLATPTDAQQLTRLRAALTTAAAGTHPTWWNWASQRDRTTVPDTDQLPWTCATCGTPVCPHLDADLLAWCDQHWTPENVPTNLPTDGA